MEHFMFITMVQFLDMKNAILEVCRISEKIYLQHDVHNISKHCIINVLRLFLIQRLFKLYPIIVKLQL